MIEEKKPPLILRGAAAQIQTSDEPEILIEGPAGTGKTLGCLIKCCRIAELYPNSRILLARATRVSMTESVLVELENNLLPANSPPRLNSDAHRAGRRNYAWPNGAELVVAGLDDTQRIMSTQYDLIYVAEATEISEEDWERLLTRLRNRRGPYHQAIADCNPAHPNHWLNKRAARGHMQRLLSRHCDNPTVTPEYLLRLSRLTGHRRARLFEGRWVAGEGTVYPEFERERHIVPTFVPPIDWPMFVGLDPGYDHPCAILWFAVAPNDDVYIIDELYRSGKSIAEHARDIKFRSYGRNVIKHYADPQDAFSKRMASPRSIADQFREYGLRFIPWPRSNDEEAMVEHVRHRLTDGTIYVCEHCENTISEFESWSYKRKTDGSKPDGPDQFEDKNNDAMDVVKGVMATHPRFKRQKIEMY